MNKADLSSDYFRRDLEPVEDEALAQELASSEEGSSRFARLAAEDYSRLGLPEPVWPGQERRGRKAWLLLLAGLGAAGIWAWRSQQAASPAPIFIAREEASQAVEAPLARPRAEVPVPVTAPRNAGAALQRLRVQASAQGFSVSLDPGPGEGLLRIEDAQGKPCCQVAADAEGHWLWRGLDAQGRPVNPGSYRLIAEAQGHALTGWVEVGRRRKP